MCSRSMLEAALTAALRAVQDDGRPPAPEAQGPVPGRDEGARRTMADPDAAFRHDTSKKAVDTLFGEYGPGQRRVLPENRPHGPLSDEGQLMLLMRGGR